MTIDEARRLFDGQRVHDEGYLDTAARLDRERGLTAEERSAIEVIWAEFVVNLREFGRASRRFVDPFATE